MKQLITLVLALFATTTWAQFAVSGIVTDENGEVLIGVTVIEKGTLTGAVTDEDGVYLINCSKNANLVFSYLGYATKEVIVADDQTTLNVSLSDGTQSLSGVEVLGTRSYNRSSTETPVPVDIIPISQVIGKTGQLDMNQLLQFAAPSFNATRQSGSDGSDHVDPASLRGLGPDQTLVLINGQRQHQSALVNLYGTRGRGNTGTDLNAIPTSAIERIEILRDGAAAQYGSDAIAGVINIVLKSNTDEFTGNIVSGVTHKGDGKNFQANANYGFKIGERGFINVTADYLSRGKTNRAADTTKYGADNVYRLEYGDASQENFGVVANSKFALTDEVDFYSFVTMNHRSTDAFAWTRFADSERNIPAIYPNGFSPHIQSTITDRTFSAGVRGKIAGFSTDFNNTFGSNKFHYYVDGSLNTSLGVKSPTRFDAGGFQQIQNTTSLKFSRYFDTVLKGFNLAFGSEYRVENYKLFAGEEASYRNYGVRDTVINGLVTPWDFLGVPGGSQGFPGFSPSNEVDAYRTNIGLYVDGEIDLAKGLTAAAAGRFERYSDFGNTLNGKFAMRYEAIKGFALRGSVSTGFRAPSLAQLYFNSLYTNVIGGQITDIYLAQNSSVVTRTLGIGALKQEKALNASLGFTAKPFTGFSLTIDGYMVNIKDRVVLTGTFTPDSTTSWGRDLLALNVGGAQFFTNAVDTKTMGLDVIVGYNRTFGDHHFGVNFAGNFNKMTIGGIKVSDRLAGYEDVYFGNREKLFLLASAPPMKLNLTFDYSIKNFSMMLRFVRFGKIELENYAGVVEKWRPKTTTDLTLSYKLTKNVSLSLGATNLLNTLPDENDPANSESGGAYEAVQMGSNGAFYFGRLGFKF